MNISEAMKNAVVRVRRRQQPAMPASAMPKQILGLQETMNATLAVVFALYVKTRNFQWHVCDSHLHDCHSMLEEHGDELYSMIEPMVERVRALGAPVLNSIGHLTHRRIVLEGDADRVQTINMLAELIEDNKALAASLRQALFACELQDDAAAARLLESWLDETQQRTLDLYDAHRMNTL